MNSIYALIVGERRQGKSTLALSIAMRFHTDVVIYDINDQYHAYLGFEEIENFRSWWEDTSVHGVVRFVPRAGSEDEQFAELVDCFRDSRGKARIGNIALVVDEAHRLQTAYQVNETLDWCIRRAPRERLNQAGQIADWSIIQTTHLMRDANLLTKDQITDVFLFRSTSRRQLEAIEREYGSEIARSVPQLGKHQVVHRWSDNGQGCFSIWRDSKRWFIALDHGRALGTGSGRDRENDRERLSESHERDTGPRNHSRRERNPIESEFGSGGSGRNK